MRFRVRSTSRCSRWSASASLRRRALTPRLIAKGADVVATKIREEAEKHSIPMVEDIPLARTLFRVCELGDEIPADLYEAVARLLAFIFSLRARGVLRPVGGGAHRPPTPLLTSTP